MNTQNRKIHVCAKSVEDLTLEDLQIHTKCKICVKKLIKPLYEIKMKISFKLVFEDKFLYNFVDMFN